MRKATARSGTDRELVSLVHRILLGQSEEQAVAGLRHDFDWISAEAADIYLGRARAALARGKTFTANVEDLSGEGGDTPALITEGAREAVVVGEATLSDGSRKTLTVRVDLRDGGGSEDIIDAVNSQTDEWSDNYNNRIQSFDWHVQYVY